jgi:hypothetical protein
MTSKIIDIGKGTIWKGESNEDQKKTTPAGEVRRVVRIAMNSFTLTLTHSLTHSFTRSLTYNTQ